MLRSHDTVPFSPKTARTDFSWPDGRRLAIHVSVNLEHFSYGEGLGISYSPGLPQPNTYNWAWREYGNRVGVWRILDLMDELELPVSLLLNSEIYDHCPEVVAAFRHRGDEVLGHGRTCQRHPDGLSAPRYRPGLRGHDHRQFRRDAAAIGKAAARLWRGAARIHRRPALSHSASAPGAGAPLPRAGSRLVRQHRRDRGAFRRTRADQAGKA